MSCQKTRCCLHALFLSPMLSPSSEQLFRDWLEADAIVNRRDQCHLSPVISLSDLPVSTVRRSRQPSLIVARIQSQNTMSIPPCPTASDTSSSVSPPPPCLLAHPLPLLRLLQHHSVPRASSSNPHPAHDLDGHLAQIRPIAVYSVPRAYPPSALVRPHTPARPRRSNRSLPDMILASPWPRRQRPPIGKRNALLHPSSSSTHQQYTMITASLTTLLHARPLLLPQRGGNQRAGSHGGGRGTPLPRHVPLFPVHIAYPIPRRW